MGEIAGLLTGNTFSKMAAAEPKPVHIIKKKHPLLHKRPKQCLSWGHKTAPREGLHQAQGLTQLLAIIPPKRMSICKFKNFEEEGAENQLERLEPKNLNLSIRHHLQIVLLEIIVESDNAPLLLESFSQLCFHLIKFLHLTLIALKAPLLCPDWVPSPPAVFDLAMFPQLWQKLCFI